MKRCPFCKEQIQDDAIKCRFCGELLKKEESQQINQNLLKAKPPKKVQSSYWLIKILLFILLSLIISASVNRDNKLFPIVGLTINILAFIGIVLSIRLLKNKKKLAQHLLALSIPLLISGIFFFVPSYSSYRDYWKEEKQGQEKQAKLEQEKQKEKQYNNEHKEEHYQKGLIFIKENKYQEAKNMLLKVVDVDINYKDTNKLLTDIDNTLMKIKNEQKQAIATRNIDEAAKLISSNSCSDLDTVISKCESALVIFPDSNRAKNLLLQAKIQKLLCFEGNNEVEMAIHIVKYQPVTLVVTIKNVSREVRHANPNHFTLVTVSGNSYHYSSETYSSEYTAFDAVDLQPGTKTSGVLVFDTNSKPKELIYSELLGTKISRKFPFE